MTLLSKYMLNAYDGDKMNYYLLFVIIIKIRIYDVEKVHKRKIIF